MAGITASRDCMTAPMSIDAQFYPASAATVRRAVQSARAELAETQAPAPQQAPASVAATCSDGHTDRPATGMHAKVLFSREAIVALQDEWQALQVRSVGSSAFQAFDICLPWLDAYVFGDQPTHTAHIIALYDGDRLAGLVPLAIRTSGMVRFAEWVGEPLIQYGDVLLDPACDKDAARACLAQALKERPVAGLLLRNVRIDARVHALLDLGDTKVGQPREAAIIDFTRFDKVEDYFSSLSKSARTNRKRKRKALARLGRLSFAEILPGAEAHDLCRLVLDWKVAWLQKRGLSSRFFMDSRAMDTLLDAVARDESGNPLRLLVQYLDDSPVAIEINLTDQLGSAMFIASYDPVLESLSAGKVLIESNIIHGFAVGWPSFDLLPPIIDYKTSWTNRTLAVHDHMIASGIQARLYRDLYLKALRPAMKRVWEAVPTGVRGAFLRIKGA